MLVKVEAQNPAGDVLTLELEDISDGLVVDEVTGLGPVKASIVSSDFAQLDGVVYQSSRRGARNVVIKLVLEPDYVTTSVYDLRTRLYDFFMPKEEVLLRFHMFDGLVVQSLGRVEDCDPEMFTQEPKTDISIICYEADLISVTPVNISGNTVSDTTETTVTYPGTSPVGLGITLNVNRTLSELTVYHRLPDGSLYSMDVQASLVAGDVVNISTVNRQKGITLTRSGATSSLLYAVSTQSTWFQLRKGDNKLRVYATGAAIPYTATWTPRYGGL